MRKILLGSVLLANLLFAGSEDAERLLNSLSIGKDFKCIDNTCIKKNIKKDNEKGRIEIDNIKIGFIDFDFTFSEEEQQEVKKVITECEGKVNQSSFCSEQNIHEKSTVVFNNLLGKIKGFELSGYKEINFQNIEIINIEQIYFKASDSFISLQNKKNSDIKKEDLNIEMELSIKDILVNRDKEIILLKLKSILFNDIEIKYDKQYGATQTKKEYISILNKNVLEMFNPIVETILNLKDNKDFKIKIETKILDNELEVKLSTNILDKNLFKLNTDTLFTIKNIDLALNTISNTDFQNQQGGMFALMSLGSNTFFNKFVATSYVKPIKEISNKIDTKEFKESKSKFIKNIKENKKELSEIELFVYNILSLQYDSGVLEINNYKNLPITTLFMLLQNSKISDTLEIKSTLK